jgi:putative methyltransferase (TIGR04325 family)
MKLMKKMIKLLIPPIMISLYRQLKKRSEQVPFSGVHNSIDEIHDENPWIQEQWIELSRNKLEGTREMSSDSFMPTSDFGGYPVLPCLITNLLSQSNPCNILDFGGGTGFAYFKMFPYLLNPENVTYHVVDSNSELFQIGKKHAKSMGNENGIVFHTEMPAKDDIQLHILYINTSLQYIYDYSSLLVMLLQYRPQYVILTRLIAGDMKTYITCQNIHGHRTPCIFINFQEIVDVFSNNGFDLVFKSPCAEEVFEGAYDNTIPKHLRIHNTANLIFERSD